MATITNSTGQILSHVQFSSLASFSSTTSMRRNHISFSNTKKKTVSMETITNTGQILSLHELPSPASFSSTSIRRNQASFSNPKKKTVPFKGIAIGSLYTVLAHKVYKGCNFIFSTGGGNGGSGTNGGFGGNGGGDGGGWRFPSDPLSCFANSEENNQSITEVQEMNLEEKFNLVESVGVTTRLIREPILEAINSCHGDKVVIGTCTETKVQLEKGGDLEAGTNLGGTTIGSRPIIPIEHTRDSLIRKIHSDTRWDKENGGVTYMQQSDDAKTEYMIVTGRGGPLTLASLEPGVTFSERRNIEGNASMIASLDLGRVFHLQDDININLKYVRPWFDGNPCCTTVYKTMKPIPDLPRGVDQVHHPKWVGTVGMKANITGNWTPQNNFAYGMVLEEIKTHNSSNGERLSDGTTTSSVGNYRLYGQATLASDNTKFVNGTIVGDKIKFQIDHSLALCECFSVFNRHQLTMTRFYQLKEAEEGVGKPSPPVLVLHAHYGGYVGDLPHDTFTLGGPDSVRGYKVGEIGAARNILEVAAEVRVPVRNTQVYVFAEHGNDFKSSIGNSTKGHGSSYGFGAKLGFVRVEYAINHNSHSGELSVRFGERF